MSDKAKWTSERYTFSEATSNRNDRAVPIRLDGTQVKGCAVPSGTIVALVFPADDRTEPQEVTAKRAAMFAAAPEMAEALRALVALWRSDDPLTDADAQQRIGAATDRAEAALRKAGAL